MEYQKMQNDFDSSDSHNLEETEKTQDAQININAIEKELESSIYIIKNDNKNLEISNEKKEINYDKSLLFFLNCICLILFFLFFPILNHDLVYTKKITNCEEVFCDVEYYGNEIHRHVDMGLELENTQDVLIKQIRNCSSDFPISPCTLHYYMNNKNQDVITTSYYFNEFDWIKDLSLNVYYYERPIIGNSSETRFFKVNHYNYIFVRIMEILWPFIFFFSGYFPFIIIKLIIYSINKFRKN